MPCQGTRARQDPKDTPYARWLLTEIEKQGVGGDRVFFGSDEPWSDFDSEYWKLNGIRGISQELKDRVFWRNFEEAFGTHA